MKLFYKHGSDLGSPRLVADSGIVSAGNDVQNADEAVEGGDDLLG